MKPNTGPFQTHCLSKETIIVAVAHKLHVNSEMGKKPSLEYFNMSPGKC